MPIQPVPPNIEVGDFTAGLYAKAEESGVPWNGLLGGSNLVLDPATGQVVTREGYNRVFTPGIGEKGYRLFSLFAHTSKNGTRFLISVLGTEVDNVANNVKLFAYRVDTDATWTQISPASQVFVKGNGRHWGTTVDGIFYGGGESDAMYSWEWKGTYGTSVWKNDVGTANFKDFPSVERPTDYAFQNGDIVEHAYTLPDSGGAATDNFMFDYDDERKISDGIRFPAWDTDEKKYRRGDKVSYKLITWHSFRCIKAHSPTTLNRPGDGTGTGRKAWTNFWDKIKAPAPVDADGRTNRKYWKKLPNAPRTRLAIWHGERLFARDDANNRQNVVFSKAVKVGDKSYGIGKDKSTGVAGNPAWEPDDWRTGGPTGAGFEPFETKEGDFVTAFATLGYYLLVFKRYSVFVIAGLNPESWTKRALADKGTVGARAATVHEGLAYFISDRGFYYSDGTEVREVPGQSNILEWLRQAINWSDGEDILLFSYKQFVWCSFPSDKTGLPNRTLLYHPETKSFWLFDFGIQAATIQQADGLDRLFFSKPNKVGIVVNAVYDAGSMTGGVWTTDNSGTKLDRLRRQSRRTGGVVDYNLFKNPSGEPESTQVMNPADWVETEPGQVLARVTKGAARWGTTGIYVKNNRRRGSTGGQFSGWEGIYQSFQDKDTGTHRIAAVVRNPNWKKDPDKKPKIRVRLGVLSLDPDDSIYLGRGWWYIYRNYFGQTSAMNKGFLIPPDTAIHIDMMLLTPGATKISFFDSVSGAAEDDVDLRGGEFPLIMRYGNTWTDDAGTGDGQVLELNAIRWLGRSAQFLFGLLREERAIRNIWALIRGEEYPDGNPLTASVRVLINHRETDEGIKRTSLDDSAPMQYLEGPVPPDASAVQIEVEGDRAPAAFLGLGIETIPWRIRSGS